MLGFTWDDCAKETVIHPLKRKQIIAPTLQRWWKDFESILQKRSPATLSFAEPANTVLEKSLCWIQDSSIASNSDVGESVSAFLKRLEIDTMVNLGDGLDSSGGDLFDKALKVVVWFVMKGVVGLAGAPIL
jgi:hypothetical protein